MTNVLQIVGKKSKTLVNVLEIVGRKSKTLVNVLQIVGKKSKSLVNVLQIVGKKSKSLVNVLEIVGKKSKTLVNDWQTLANDYFLWIDQHSMRTEGGLKSMKAIWDSIKNNFLSLDCFHHFSKSK